MVCSVLVQQSASVFVQTIFCVNFDTLYCGFVMTMIFQKFPDFVGSQSVTAEHFKMVAAANEERCVAEFREKCSG